MESLRDCCCDMVGKGEDVDDCDGEADVVGEAGLPEKNSATRANTIQCCCVGESVFVQYRTAIVLAGCSSSCTVVFDVCFKLQGKFNGDINRQERAHVFLL